MAAYTDNPTMTDISDAAHVQLDDVPLSPLPPAFTAPVVTSTPGITAADQQQAPVKKRKLAPSIFDPSLTVRQRYRVLTEGDECACCVQRKCCIAYTVMGILFSFIVIVLMFSALTAPWLNINLEKDVSSPASNLKLQLLMYLDRIDITSNFDGGQASPSVTGMATCKYRLMSPTPKIAKTILQDPSSTICPDLPNTGGLFTKISIYAGIAIFMVILLIGAFIFRMTTRGQELIKTRRLFVGLGTVSITLLAVSIITLTATTLVTNFSAVSKDIPEDYFRNFGCFYFSGFLSCYPSTDVRDPTVSYKSELFFGGSYAMVMLAIWIAVFVGFYSCSGLCCCCCKQKETEVTTVLTNVNDGDVTAQQQQEQAQELESQQQ